MAVHTFAQRRIRTHGPVARRVRLGLHFAGGTKPVRRAIAVGCLLALTVGCAHASPRHALAPPPAPVPGTTPAGHPEPLVAPYARIETGPIRALVPKAWASQSIDLDSMRQGLVASPHPKRWDQLDGTVPGLEVAWVDSTRVGIPSDLYYFAAAGPAIPAMASSRTCSRDHFSVLVNHRPLAGDPFSPGDYVERGYGTCRHRGHATHWAYFVAAPGFGPLRQLGIPTSGLYLAVAVVPESPSAEKRLQTIIRSAQYGSASVAELMQAARQSAQLG